MTTVKILFSCNNNEKVVQFPVVPDELPDILQSLSNESFETNTKTLTLLGSKKLGSFSFRIRKKSGGEAGFAFGKTSESSFSAYKRL